MSVLQVLAEIGAERQRQIRREGFSAAHDDEHVNDDLAVAAGVYALWDTGLLRSGPTLRAKIKSIFPWPNWFKPKPGRRRNLVRAAALIVAEIQRIDRRGEDR